MPVPLLVLAAGAALAAPGPSRVAALPPCAANALSLGTDAEDGRFAGMQHGGTLLVVRNLGPTACRIEALPRLTLYDEAGRRLPVSRAVPPGMHPGPVVLPVGLASGAEATAAITWIAGPAFTRSRCHAVATVRVTIAGTVISAAFPATICGEGARATFNQVALATDPVL